ncbi:hypothetical protein N018_07805 [Pseudomonas syringae CC1557]|uniref:Uncharacterized protein n=1 Tax=Pseudomonas syringae CC1557 TaxID=1357279 RepID=W0N2L9_PSESX|nr:hypothetical protein N018_07805 [Pseudomonas syringae CC1557]
MITIKIYNVNLLMLIDIKVVDASLYQLSSAGR